MSDAGEYFGQINKVNAQHKLCKMNLHIIEHRVWWLILFICIQSIYTTHFSYSCRWKEGYTNMRSIRIFVELCFQCWLFRIWSSTHGSQAFRTPEGTSHWTRRANSLYLWIHPMSQQQLSDLKIYKNYINIQCEPVIPNGGTGFVQVLKSYLLSFTGHRALHK